MRATRIVLEHVHTPRIRFLGRRVWNSQPEKPQPHPEAPKDFKDNFAQFVQKRQDYVQPSKNNHINFWELPDRFHKHKFAPYSDYEIEAIEVSFEFYIDKGLTNTQSGGASLY
ncbi:hypothetical protein E3Q22_01551 [Wallemia mellicola]|uniref:Uncharacterized protein n=1 Tax=Wallemia mellicola TaxID=1708541 RepID=A0A4T0QH86_9BASI|nr:hypothetical protein E3Q22_01551 [Wallemia mellicola]TIC07910.1 hypothetical protein E3Q14_04157 [Wallemia mellicola]TIC15551.1 hypothetical protein E3Q15_01368 [Wallemia mellicola]TIC19100.1 hypothetical protein E3Q13_01518 [Wallemia mellicola]TIC22898.1 hypothetical protein E3Q11_04027 [Wallemia mellicola]